MHFSAEIIGKHFFELYAKQNEQVIVEIGSQSVNGGLRNHAPPACQYIGLDFVVGDGVDIILDDPYSFPLDNNVADIIVSSSVFEHAEHFWLTFLEGMRILKDGGFFYINAPSNGYFHRYPQDCWRFYPDSANALCRWGRKNGYDVNVVECFTASIERRILVNDQVIIFTKGKTSPALSVKLSDKVRTFNQAIVENGLVKDYCNMQETDQMATFLKQLINGYNKIKTTFPEGNMRNSQDLSQEDQNFLFNYVVEMEKLMTKIDF